ncbi:hypothetical protein EVAR_76972_1 [Eumeta japonica]|uniref:RNA-directed DNA polymerase from mobile element jockey n=1 Tax=Eumeta variegata TaxID=151549 RepID=A0A4C1SEZ2_EUMVA|nr:hypothetical protein EVAR_76972_1 [Eumeta japonica]
MFSGQSASSVEKDIKRTLTHVHSWEVKNKLRFTLSKPNSVVFTKKLKYDDPVVHMDGEQINQVGEIRFLGLTIDRKVTFIPHVVKAFKQATKIYKGLVRATWILGVDAVQRSVALKTCRVHRIVSLHSTLILSKLLLLDNRVRSKVGWLCKLKRGNDLEDTFVNR